MGLEKLLGVLVVIVGFALKLDSILIVVVAAIVSAAAGGLGVEGLLEALGTSFVNNRSMAIFILIMLVTGTLERNGLKEAAAKLIRKVKRASAGTVVGAYGIMRGIFAAFNVSFGGVAGFVRPIIMPMAVGAIEASGNEPNEEHVENVSGILVIAMTIPAIFKQVKMGKSNAPEPAEEKANFEKIGMKIFIPSLTIGVSAILFALPTKLGALVGIGFGIILSMVLLMIYSRKNTPKVFLDDSS